MSVFIKTLRKSFFIKLLLMLALAAAPLMAQNFNPPFPRTMFQRPGGTAGGACEQFFAKYDLAIHAAGADVAKDANARIRALNPNTIILGTSRQGVWPGSFPPECFIYREAYATLTRTAQPGDTEIMVTTTTGFRPASGDYYLLIGEDDWVTFSGMTGSSFTGIPTSDFYAIDESHTVGDSVKTTVRFVGFGMLQNITSFAPLVNGQEVWQYFIDKRFDPAKQDFSVFDGVFYDAYRVHFWSEDIPGGVDLDYNHIDDFDEHGLDWFNDQWAEGVKPMLTYEHQKLAQTNPGKPPIIAINTGAAEGGYVLDYAEGMMWEGFMRFASDWWTMLDINRQWEQKHQTAFTMIEDYDPEKRAAYSKTKYAYMRYGLTTALMAGAFYGRTYGDSYYMSQYFDEFDTDLGYPSSDPQRLASGVYVRFFDKGAAICNPTGTYVTVSASDLTGLTGYQGPYYRFKGGQVPTFNNGELFTSVQLEGTNEDPSRPKAIKGDGILLLTQPDTVVSDMTVGNTFNNDTSPSCNAVELTGSWLDIEDPNGPDAPFATRNPCYSQWNQGDEATGYHLASPGDGSTFAIFRPVVGVPGYYEVSEWHGWAGNSPDDEQEGTNVPFEIVVNGVRKTSGVIDQTIKLGRWNRIAVLQLPVGNNNYVRITNQGNGMIIADAMRFRYLGTNFQIDTVPPEPPRNVKVLPY